MPKRYHALFSGPCFAVWSHFRVIFVTQMALGSHFPTTWCHCGNHRLWPGLRQSPVYVFYDSITILGIFRVYILHGFYKRGDCPSERWGYIQSHKAPGRERWTQSDPPLSPRILLSFQLVSNSSSLARLVPGSEKHSVNFCQVWMELLIGNQLEGLIWSQCFLIEEPGQTLQGCVGSF